MHCLQICFGLSVVSKGSYTKATVVKQTAVYEIARWNQAHPDLSFQLIACVSLKIVIAYACAYLFSI